jgi:hypothetical protein
MTRTADDLFPMGPIYRRRRQRIGALQNMTTIQVPSLEGANPLAPRPYLADRGTFSCRLGTTDGEMKKLGFSRLDFFISLSVVKKSSVWCSKNLEIYSRLLMLDVPLSGGRI